MEDKFRMGVEPDPELTGIGGWLIFAMIGLIIDPFNILINLSNVSELMTETNFIKQLEIPMAYFHVAKVGYIVLLALSILMLYLFFTKKRLYVLSVYVDIGIRTILIIALTTLVKNVPAIYGELMVYSILGTLVNIIRIMYYIKSQRVKNTFVN